MKRLSTFIEKGVDKTVNFISNRIVYLGSEDKDVVRECIKNFLWWLLLMSCFLTMLFLPYWYDQLMK